MTLDMSSDLIQSDRLLGPMTTYKLGGPARWFAEPSTLPQLEQVLGVWRASGVPLAVLGRGSNVLVSDDGFEGLVVRLAGDFTTVEVGRDGVVAAGAAAPLPVVARAAVKSGRRGLEFLVGIPGSVGGAVRMNAGCHGSEMVEWLIEATVIDTVTGDVSTIPVDALHMSYRHSELTGDQLVIDASLRTVAGSVKDGETALRDVGRWRKEHQPGGTLNAGSVFKNPPGDAAGRIVEAAGLKGVAVGGASISQRHANFIEAGAGATAIDVYRLIVLAREQVAARLGIALEPEVRFIGAFGQGGGRR